MPIDQTLQVCTIRVERVRKLERGFKSCEAFDSRRNSLNDHKPTAPGKLVEVANKTLVPVQGYGGIELGLQQPSCTTAVKPKNVAYLSALGRNLSTRHASETSGGPFINYLNKAQLCLGKGSTCPFHLGESGILELMEQHCNNTGDEALSLRASLLRCELEVHRLLDHPSEEITLQKQLGVSSQVNGCHASPARRRNFVETPYQCQWTPAKLSVSLWTSGAACLRCVWVTSSA